MISRPISSRGIVTATSLKAHRPHTFRAFYAVSNQPIVLRQPTSSPSEGDELPASENDFILSILRANPSSRDTRSYVQSFGGLRLQQKHKVSPSPVPLTPASATEEIVIPPPPTERIESTAKSIPKLADEHPKPRPIIASILNPVIRRTALVKVQGPFTDVQLDSISRGLVYLEKLGLVSVIVVENDEQYRGEQDERTAIVEETMRVVNSLEKQGARARPVVGAVVRLGPKPGDEEDPNSNFAPPEAHTISNDLSSIRSALRAGEIPVIAPFALDSFLRSVRVDANDVIAGLARGMVEASALDKSRENTEDGFPEFSEEVDLTPLRLMIINREGGVPSYARSGYPHLLINLTSEYNHIHETFEDKWRYSKPTALSNLALARTCLNYMPPTSSAIMVSHKSPSALIGNLITNKPAVSSSLPHALLQGNRKLTPHTPTLLRKGSPIQVFRSTAELNKPKLNALLEQSFKRELDEEAFYKRLDETLDFVIVAGDYAGAAIVTNEPDPFSPDTPVSYLDKFAILPSHQGDGTVDFLWVALHDETYGLGHPFSANPNGGRGGVGEGRDLVWRSRANNPVNKWYFERSTGHIRLGSWVLFWCDAEKRLKIEEGRRGSAGLSFVEEWEKGRLDRWTDIVMKIPSSWK
ncbi:Amino-acid acetyltransferase, mitochondrial [Leucoagaricus sp. SymC.cos]|nr:Amino-acid acetyltransferase, mitochondrial [Leucoagaricus sp. SymC.cos]